MLTIVTVVKGDKAGLEKTLASARKQSEKDWQLVVVFPESDFEIAEYVYYMNSADNRITGIVEDSPGIYQAMNTALREKKSEFFWFMNAGDCFTNEDSIKQAIGTIEELSADLIVGGYSVSGDQKYDIKRLEILTARKFSLNVRKGCHQAMVFRSDKSMNFVNFDSEYSIAADFLKVLNCAKKGRAYWVPLNLATITPGGVSHARIHEVIEEKQLIREAFFGKKSVDYFLGWIWGTLLRIKIIIRNITGNL